MEECKTIVKGSPVDVQCTVYPIEISNETYNIYEYFTDDSRFLDYIIRDENGIIIEKHNHLWKRIAEAFVDSTPD